MNQIITGDALSVIQQLPPESINCCVTSPPYFGLRDYGIAGQMGLEQTPEEYVTKLVEVFREVRRTLKKNGTVWLNLGDSYAGSWGNAGGQNRGHGTQRPIISGSIVKDQQQRNGDFIPPAKYGFKSIGIKQKDLIGIPWRVAFALQADGWWLRSDIIWHKPNCMPESVTDRPTKAHEYIFLLSKSQRYYYDKEAILEPHSDETKKYFEKYTPDHSKSLSDRKIALGDKGKTRTGFGNSRAEATACMNPSGRNKRTVWTIPTKPFKEAHFATFPEALVEPCILAGCPVGGVVLDPFFGAGTTGVVAKKLGRCFIGIDLNPEYCEIAEKRISEVKR